MRHSYTDWAYAVCALALGFYSCSAAAQSCEPVPPATPDTVLLARLCVHEAGWGRRTRAGWEPAAADCAGIHAVIERVRNAISRRHRACVPYSRAMRAYSSSLFDVERSDPKCYAPFLDASGLEPACWGGTVPWERRRDSWAALLSAAERIYRGELSHSCEAPPHHWGCGDAAIAQGCQDHARALRLGMDRVDCGPTLNRFYRARRLALAERRDLF